MDTERAANELRIIRQLMERPIRCSTMSGLSGILAGTFALLGLWGDAAVCAAWAQPDDKDIRTVANIAVWAGVFLASLTASVLLTLRREHKVGMPFWSPVKKRILMTILPPFVAGVGLTLVIVHLWYFGVGPNHFGLIPPIWMLFYGLACWQVGELSIRELRWLGAAFILSGLATALCFQVHVPGQPYMAPYWTIGLTFGGFHLIYGAVVWARHGG